MSRKIGFIIAFILFFSLFVISMRSHAFGETQSTIEDNDCLYPGQIDTDHSTDDVLCVSPTPPTLTPMQTVTVSSSPTATTSADTPTGSGGNPPTFNTSSDGLSDGKSSCPACTQPPPTIPVPLAPATGHATN